MRYAIVENGIVTNTVISDSLPPNGVESDVAGPGWSYNGTSFIPLPPPPPDPVTTAKFARQNAFKADQTVADWTDRLDSATVAQIDSYFANNVNNAAQAIAVLKSIVKYLVTK